MVWSYRRRRLLPFAPVRRSRAASGPATVAALVATVLAGQLSVAAAEEDGPKVTAKSALILHNKTGTVLYARNANEVRSIASLTKLAAALVIRARGVALDKGTTINRDDHKVGLGGCRTRLELKWTYRNRDLLHAALMASDNRAVSALGRAVKLSANGLVQAMNELAGRMGLKKTTFRGPVGIDHGNTSTAWEISRIIRKASKDPVLSGVMSKHEYDVKPMKGYLRIHYRNTNPLVGEKKRYEFIASKTGYNDEAGYCLASVVRLRRLGEVTFVLLGSKRKIDRIYDARHVLEWLRKHGAAKLKRDPS